MNRNRYFKIGIIIIAIGIAIAAWVLALAAIAGSAETSVYAISVTEGAGFDAGVGLAAEYAKRWEHIGFALDGKALNQKKHNADTGWKYGVGAQGRIYYDRLYIGAGGAYSGYDSEFENGTHWEKSAVWPVASVGFDAENYDLWATHYFEENETENEIQSTKVGASCVAWGGVKTFIEIAHVQYTQAGERDDDIIATVGAGWQF